jgi:hypothetical protein
MLFSRSGLSFNNNGCGFAGCVGHAGFVGFVGNFMYGTGSGYFEIAAGPGSVLYGLEFVVGTGYSDASVDVVWEAYRNAVLVGNGSTSLATGAIVGFNDPAGFDVLRYSDLRGAPAFDTVFAQYSSSPSQVPEPATFLYVAGGLAALGLSRRRTRK